MKRNYQKALRKLNQISFIKIALTVILFIISINVKKVPVLIPILLVFLYVFFLIEFFISRRNYKEIYEYTTGKKKYNYRKIQVPNDRFVELVKNGIPANTYISYNDSVHAIETKDNKYFYIDYREYKSLDDFLNASIANIKIRNIETITFLSFNGEAPRTYIK